MSLLASIPVVDSSPIVEEHKGSWHPTTLNQSDISHFIPIGEPEPTIQKNKVDVLIVGAGPSGLFLAQALIRLGVTVTVIDRRSRDALYGNADGLQPRTLEIWKSYGILESIKSKGACMHAMVAYQKSPDGTALHRGPPSNNVIIPCRYPYEITAHIRDIEDTLRYSFEMAGGQVLQPTQPLSIGLGTERGTDLATSYPCKITVFHGERSHPHPPNIPEASLYNKLRERDLQIEPSETETVYAKYVVGADGAHSWVRKAVNIPLEGEDTESVWGVADVHIETDFPDYRFKCVIQSASGAVIIIPREGDKIRIYVQIIEHNFLAKNDNGRIDRLGIPQAKIQDIVSRHKKDSPHIILSLPRFSGPQSFQARTLELILHTNLIIDNLAVPQKVAQRFSHNNRVFIVGDACHTHSPKAGQGANASMGDSHNLAWKLAYVIRGWAKPSLLQTYEDERRTYAQDLIAFDREISESLEVGTAEDYRRLLHKQNLFTSGIGIHYSKSRLTVSSDASVTSDKRVKNGQRIPFGPVIRLADWEPYDLQDLCLSDGTFKLLIFPGDIQDSVMLESLRTFAAGFEVAKDKSSFPSGKVPLQDMLAIHTIATSDRIHVSWKDIPPNLASSWGNCFTFDPRGQGINDFFLDLIHNEKGLVILVRPDGYISIIMDMVEDASQNIFAFLESLQD
ncbi:hypothetical protein M422DRAFT_782649 [Sphaerobolus stellatus SS14]|uniref:Phenol 2-monooxygenase n=1 Tax=Sphaerobolus stellatus (strain SS14) TaxID=990650 RepID=A0A0C9VBQ9_SPHS4|nr:hypothetical protein M422DRAFT_782649 [Sphaerobolus stellatus SS14]